MQEQKFMSNKKINFLLKKYPKLKIIKNKNEIIINSCNVEKNKIKNIFNDLWGDF